MDYFDPLLSESPEENVVRSVLLPRPCAREEEVWRAGMEHSVRVQRDRFTHQRETAAHVPQPVHGKDECQSLLPVVCFLVG